MELLLPTQRQSQEELKSLLDAKLITEEEYLRKGGVPVAKSPTLLTKVNSMDKITGSQNPTVSPTGLGKKIASGQGALVIPPTAVPTPVTPIPTATPVEAVPTEEQVRKEAVTDVAKKDQRITDTVMSAKRRFDADINKIDTKIDGLIKTKIPTDLVDTFVPEREKLVTTYTGLVQAAEEAKQRKMDKYEKDKLITGLAKVAEFLGQSIVGYMAAVKGAKQGQDLSGIQGAKANWSAEYDALRADLDRSIDNVNSTLKQQSVGIEGQREDLGRRSQVDTENQRNIIRSQMDTKEQELRTLAAQRQDITGAQREAMQQAGATERAIIQSEDNASAALKRLQSEMTKEKRDEIKAKVKETTAEDKDFDKKLKTLNSAIDGLANKKTREQAKAQVYASASDLGIKLAETEELISSSEPWYSSNITAEAAGAIYDSLAAKAIAARGRPAGASTTQAPTGATATSTGQTSGKAVKLSQAMLKRPGKTPEEVKAELQQLGYTILPE
jgi:hypothetical protein